MITLHALWDQSYGWGILLTQGLRDGVWELDWPATEDWVGVPTGNELLVWQVIYDGLLVINAAIGASWVLHNWRKYRTSEPVRGRARNRYRRRRPGVADGTDPAPDHA